MSAKRTAQTPKRVSFRLPQDAVGTLQTSSPTQTRYLSTPNSNLQIPIKSTIPNPRRQTSSNFSPTPNCSLPTPTRTPSRQPSPRHRFSALAPHWPFNEQDTTLIRAGYEPQWNPTRVQPTSTDQGNQSKGKSTIRPTMAEPRARMARHKGQMNFQNELRLLLLAYGDPSPHPSFPNEPLPETVRVLDEIVTDFVLEVSHGAAQVAHHARRQKIKVEDFRFALRRDPNKLGRVQELLRMERELKEARKAFDQNDDQVAKEAGKKGAAAAAAAAAAGEDPEAAEAAATANATKKSKGKGKRGAAVRRGSDATEESVSKKRKTIG
ncbi:hypothetical protein N7475_001168 [Penicillium sp. IBT 31633x]|nr:hypothetical protein N7475_001168 [Penicillium sp. IBT 31633x]